MSKAWGGQTRPVSEFFGIPGQIREILAGIQQLQQKVNAMSEQQTDINNAVTAITGLLTDLGNQTTTILADVTAIQAALQAGQPVDTTALDSAVSGIQSVDTALDDAVTSLSALNPPASTSTPPSSAAPSS